MTTVISGIVMLGILVFIHELGHFSVAKLCGVRVLKFSLGFGPKLLARQWGETEYLICAIPLGGYVQMLGENSNDNTPLTEEEIPFSFAHKPVLQRMAIIAAGPAMNLILPFLILPIAFLSGVEMPTFLEAPPCIGYVIENPDISTPPFSAGDCILTLNKQQVTTWDETNRQLLKMAGQPLIFSVKRGDSTLDIHINEGVNSIEGLQAFGLLPQQTAVIGALAPGMPAETAGFEAGDQIIRIAGDPVTSWYDIRPLVQQQSVDRPFSVHILRQGTEKELNVLAQQQKEAGPLLIGISPLQQTIFKRFGFIEAVKAGKDRALELIDLTLVFLRKLIGGNVPGNSIGGPIAVIQIAGQAAQSSLAAVISVLAFLSVQLGILNLLPIPILDGGHLFFNLYELVLRKPLSLRARETAQQIGLFLLLGIMVFAFYNDIARLFFGVSP